MGENTLLEKALKQARTQTGLPETVQIQPAPAREQHLPVYPGIPTNLKIPKGTQGKYDDFEITLPCAPAVGDCMHVGGRRFKVRKMHYSVGFFPESRVWLWVTLEWEDDFYNKQHESQKYRGQK